MYFFIPAKNFGLNFVNLSMNYSYPLDHSVDLHLTMSSASDNTCTNMHNVYKIRFTTVSGSPQYTLGIYLLSLLGYGAGTLVHVLLGGDLLCCIITA